ncbi:SIP domain-containing protein [Corynebacterium stationis]|uniref:SIP domain-containing protein n=1 Tax=Corynebacterium stationis TaxID=1705 RepID=UPI0019826905
MNHYSLTEKPGELALKALAEATLPNSEVHAHTIGEQALATGERRHLVQERGVPKRNVDFVGYWRHGRAQTS